MANPKLRLEENVAGEFFVDSTCIDCDTCRQLAPLHPLDLLGELRMGAAIALEQSRPFLAQLAPALPDDDRRSRLRVVRSGS